MRRVVAFMGAVLVTWMGMKGLHTGIEYSGWVLAAGIVMAGFA